MLATILRGIGTVKKTDEERTIGRGRERESDWRRVKYGRVEKRKRRRKTYSAAGAALTGSASRALIAGAVVTHDCYCVLLLVSWA